MSAADRSIADLLTSLCDETISADEMRRLDHLICTDPSVRRLYLEYLDLHARLSFQGTENGNAECGMRNDELPESTSSEWMVESGKPSIQHSLPAPLSTLPSPLSPLHSPLSTLPSFVGGILFSYLIAALVLGTALAVAWAWKLPDYTQIAGQSVPRSSPPAPNHSPKMEFVAQVTGMVDCEWADSNTATIDRAYIPVGRTYALASGLMEITYATGAKVILQGPCTYRVESKAGGYLSIGKLTAKVEKKAEGGGRKVEETISIANPKSDILNPKSASPFPLPPSALFSVRTPTATVTDLGTEFGVEVGKQGETTSHVFRGSVRLQAISSDGEAKGTGKVLHANESARVVNGDGHGDADRIETLGPSAKPTDFVRDIRKRTLKTLDLVDVVAGGDGFSGRRNAGIDPTNGQATDRPPKDIFFDSDGKYHRVETLPFVDGVFIPSGRAGPVQLDSAGHTFAEFAVSNDKTSSHVWAGGAIPAPAALPYPLVVPTAVGGVDYASPGHGLLFLHANKGIAFDLEAIRRANPDHKLIRFRSVVGNTETTSEQDSAVNADVWVFVDGQERFKRREINGYSGACPVNVPIRENDRFLTLAATDAGNGIKFDWILFGDPRLELVPAKTVAKEETAR